MVVPNYSKRYPSICHPYPKRIGVFSNWAGRKEEDMGVSFMGSYATRSIASVTSVFAHFSSLHLSAPLARFGPSASQSSLSLSLSLCVPSLYGRAGSGALSQVGQRAELSFFYTPPMLLLLLRERRTGGGTDGIGIRDFQMFVFA